MNTLNFQKIGFEAISSMKENDRNAQRNAALNLPHLLRAHGLAATLGFGADKSDAAIQSITLAFVSSLDQICAVDGTNAAAKIEALKTERQATYLLHSRLALKLADGIALAARALWAIEINKPTEAT